MTNNESFNSFKNSFFYGSRVDLNFKFLKDLPDAEAADFFQEILWKLGDMVNDGDTAPLIEAVESWQGRGYAHPSSWQYEDGPFTPLSKPLSKTRIGLLTSTGHYVTGNDPQSEGGEDMSQAEAIKNIGDFLRKPPALAHIPTDMPLDQLRVRHGGFDVRGTMADPNVALPIQRLQELANEGVIGEFVSPAYSFIGACAQTPLIKKTGPQWVQQFQDMEVDAVVLVPV